MDWKRISSLRGPELREFARRLGRNGTSSRVRRELSRALVQARLAVEKLTEALARRIYRTRASAPPPPGVPTKAAASRPAEPSPSPDRGEGRGSLVGEPVPASPAPPEPMSSAPSASAVGSDPAGDAAAAPIPPIPPDPYLEEIPPEMSGGGGDRGPDLPPLLGAPALELLVRDPWTLWCWWELPSTGDVSAGPARTPLELRLLGPHDKVLESRAVDPSGDAWFEVPPETAAVAVLGERMPSMTSDGFPSFVPLLWSRPIRTPRASASTLHRFEMKLTRAAREEGPVGALVAAAPEISPQLEGPLRTGVDPGPSSDAPTPGGSIDAVWHPESAPHLPLVPLPARSVGLLPPRLRARVPVQQEDLPERPPLAARNPAGPGAESPADRPIAWDPALPGPAASASDGIRPPSWPDELPLRIDGGRADAGGAAAGASDGAGTMPPPRPPPPPDWFQDVAAEVAARARAGTAGTAPTGAETTDGILSSHSLPLPPDRRRKRPPERVPGSRP